jgi:hypothetical protein
VTPAIAGRFMVRFSRPLYVRFHVNTPNPNLLSCRFATRYQYGNNNVQVNIVQFAAEKLIADTTVNLKSLTDEQKLGRSFSALSHVVC